MKISTEVLRVLSKLEIDGYMATIAEPLPRPLYVNTDKVLQALGGKWNRKAKAHVFDGDARERIEQAMMTGDVTIAKDVGWFPTPDVVARDLVRLACPHGLDGRYVLEPSAGEGALVDAALSFGAAGVVAIERDTRRRNLLRTLPYPRMAVMGAVTVPGGQPSELDFMSVTYGDATALLPDGARFSVVLMNPPFCKVGVGDHLEHVRHAYGFLDVNGVLAAILPAGVVFREDRRHSEFRAWALDNGGVFADLPDQSFRPSGTDVRTVTLRMPR